MAADREHLMPGFSDGTAGVAYVWPPPSAPNRSDLAEVVTRGRAPFPPRGPSGGGAVPHAIRRRPGGPAAAYGWCHGPAGTVRKFPC